MQEPSTESESSPPPDLIVNGAAPPAVPRAPRLRTIGLATLAGAIGIGAIAIAVFAGGPRSEAAPAAADGLASGSTPIGEVSGWTAPAAADGMRLERGGMGGMRGAMGGAIAITAIDGTRLALQTDNGWTRTIDAAGATVTANGATVALASLEVGDRIDFRETRGADGTFKITAIEVIQPAVAGTVASISGSTITVTRPDGTTAQVVLTGSTTYQLGGQAASREAVVAGARIVARGTLATDGTLTAASVQVAPEVFAGTVKEKGADSLTLTTRDGSTVIVKVTPSTVYQVDEVDSATLADVKVGDVVMAAGTRNADGSLSATVVRSRAAGMPGGPGDGPGRDGPGGGPGGGFGRGGGGPGGMWGDGPGGGFPGRPDAPPDPPSAPTGSGTNG